VNKLFFYPGISFPLINVILV